MSYLRGLAWIWVAKATTSANTNTKTTPLFIFCVCALKIGKMMRIRGVSNKNVECEKKH
jgi:hypothetical protein